MHDAALTSKLNAALQSREQRSLLRHLPQSSSPNSTDIIDFNSNDYLSLRRSLSLRNAFLTKLAAAPDVLGAGGSRLLVNGTAHAALEERAARLWRADQAPGAEVALLFNSGFDANAGLFACVPQPGDVLVYDAHIHASVHDGARVARVAARYAFAHNNVKALREVLRQAKATYPALSSRPTASLFLAVESVYSMDGTLAPLTEMADAIEEEFPFGNAHLIVDEAHATGIYGPCGLGRVAELGIEGRVLARLHTFGKALAGSGAVLLIPPLIKSYLLNYARPLIYTTAPAYPAVVAADCALDVLEDGTAQKLAEDLRSAYAYLVSRLRVELKDVPKDVVRLPEHLVEADDADSSQHNEAPSAFAPIIPLLTPYPRSLAGHLAISSRGAIKESSDTDRRPISARPIVPPTATPRVRVCVQAGHTRKELDALVNGVAIWAKNGGWMENGTHEKVGKRPHKL
ncbi:pyridoxal phosphate-dependent transferase [Schizophyllum amplum]|uniref:Pyridoxal phosphate-dependent transferase n=1 Tax=Schizophyllum amplum TaxID=97359 RepID=A0A550CNB7_9AGAR|nr:pyridoxal phosphate-dependent transferase [Auriculariopsis ampla]